MKNATFLRDFVLSLSLFWLLFFSSFQLIVWMLTIQETTLGICSTFKKLVPLSLYILSKTYNCKRNFKKPFQLITISAIITLTTLWLLGVPFKQVFGFNWTYMATIEYLTFALVYFHLLSRKFNNFNAFILTSFLLVASGVIYEIPIRVHRQPLDVTLQAFINPTHPFLLHSAWIMLALAIKEIGIKTFVNPAFIPSYALLALSLVLSHFATPNTITSNLVRLPILVFWCIPLSNLQRGKGQHEA